MSKALTDLARRVEQIEREMRVNALTLAHVSGERPEDVVARAKAYLAFLNSDD